MKALLLPNLTKQDALLHTGRVANRLAELGVSCVCLLYTSSLAFSGRDLFHYIDCIAQLTKEDVLRRLSVQLRPEYSALSVVLPQ